MSKEMRKIRVQAYMEGKEAGKILGGLSRNKEIAQKLMIAKIDLKIISEVCNIPMDSIERIKKRLEKENKLM